MFALKYAKQRITLDFGCGEGYGSKLLSPTASSIFAIDISPIAVKITHDRLKGKTAIADGRAAPFKSDYFDLIVSFEVFEHITNSTLYLSEAFRLLHENGVFIMSTPNVEHYPLAGMNPHHVREYSVDEVRNLLRSAGFHDINIFTQIPKNPKIEKLENSKFLLQVMKLKRKFGFHGNLLPKFFRNCVHRKISKGSIGDYSDEDYMFVEDKEDSSEIIYISTK